MEKTHKTYNYPRKSFLEKLEARHYQSIIKSRKFDSVIGTAVLGMIFDRYGFDFEINETHYQVFTILWIDEQPFVLESTLKIGGMISRSSEIKKYIDAYKPEEDSYYLSLNQRIGSTEIDYSDKTIFRSINLRELAGLQYYNDAIFHFNQQAYRISEVQLKTALKFYLSERIEGLCKLTINQAFKSSGTNLEKRTFKVVELKFNYLGIECTLIMVY